MTSKRKTGTKSEQFNEEKNTEIRKKVGEITVETALGAVSTAQATIGKTLASLGEKLQSELQNLETIKKARELEQAEAERIHGVAAIALSVEEAEANAEARKDELDRDVAAHEQLLTDRKADSDRALQATIQVQTDAQNRAHDQWRFNFEIEKRNTKAALDEETRLARVAEQVRKEGLEKDWTNREEGLKKQEIEVVELRAKVTAFPEELDKAVKKAEAIVGSSMKRDKEHEVQLLINTHLSQKTVSDNTIATLREQLSAKDKVIDQLTVQLAAAHTAQKEIANKALETASNVKAMADIQSANALGANNGQKRA